MTLQSAFRIWLLVYDVTPGNVTVLLAELMSSLNVDPLLPNA